MVLEVGGTTPKKRVSMASREIREFIKKHKYMTELDGTETELSGSTKLIYSRKISGLQIQHGKYR